MVNRLKKRAVDRLKRQRERWFADRCPNRLTSSKGRSAVVIGVTFVAFVGLFHLGLPRSLTQRRPLSRNFEDIFSASK